MVLLYVLTLEPFDPLEEMNRLADCLGVLLWEYAWDADCGKMVELDDVAVLVVLACGLALNALLYSVIMDLKTGCSGTKLQKNSRITCLSCPFLFLLRRFFHFFKRELGVKDQNSLITF